jgi:peroxiredoxin
MSFRDLSVLLLLTGLALPACGDDKDDDDDDDDDAVDSDGDGLSDSEEADLGSDPESVDSDGDGQDDGVEVEQGTIPTNAYSRLYAGGYNVNVCDVTPEPTSATGPNNDYANTWAAGDIIENFQLMDQNGELVDLYSFCGNYVLIAIGAMWCPPCKEMAAEAQAHQDEFGEGNFQMLEVLIENNSSQPPSNDDLNKWADDYDMTTVPVLDDSGYALWPYVERDWGIPTTVMIGPNMEVIAVDEYTTDPGRYIE